MPLLLLLPYSGWSESTCALFIEEENRPVNWNSILFTDIRLLDEVTQCVRQLHRNPEQKDELCFLEKYAAGYFSGEEHSIALN